MPRVHTGGIERHQSHRRPRDPMNTKTRRAFNNAKPLRFVLPPIRRNNIIMSEIIRTYTSRSRKICKLTGRLFADRFTRCSCSTVRPRRSGVQGASRNRRSGLRGSDFCFTAVNFFFFNSIIINLFELVKRGEFPKNYRIFNDLSSQDFCVDGEGIVRTSL